MPKNALESEGDEWLREKKKSNANTSCIKGSKQHQACLQETTGRPSVASLQAEVSAVPWCTGSASVINAHF